jgi:hypothetical protein
MTKRRRDTPAPRGTRTDVGRGVRGPAAAYVSDEELVRLVVERITSLAPELCPRADECPPGMLWVVVTDVEGRALCFGAGDEIWEGDLYDHVHGAAVTAFDGVATRLPSTNRNANEVAAAVVDAVSARA